MFEDIRLAKKYYVVWKGRIPGIYTDWTSCKKQVDKFSGGKFKSFATRDEAEAAFTWNSVNTTKTNKPLSTKKHKPSKSSLPTLTNEQVDKICVNTKVFSDGACQPNPGEAGSGISIYRDNRISELWYGLYNAHGTNNTAELNALYQAFIVSKDELASGRTVAVFCDSQYSIQCVTEWAVSWEKNGWKKSRKKAGGEIKNLNLIQKMFSLYQSLKDKIEVFHVNGHVGIEGNELADRMSVLAIVSVEEDFCLYKEKINIEEVLSMRV